MERIGRSSPEYFPQLMNGDDIGCSTLRNMNDLALDRVEWRPVVASNQS